MSVHAQRTEPGHSHPRLRLDAPARISAGNGEGEDYRYVSVDDDPDKVALLADAIGAGFDHCRNCVDRHAQRIADDPLLVVWLAWALACQVGSWVQVPTGPDPDGRRLRMFTHRIDPGPAAVVSALYEDGDGIGAAAKMVDAMTPDQRMFTVDVLVQALFHGLRMMNGPIDAGDRGLLNTGARTKRLDGGGYIN